MAGAEQRARETATGFERELGRERLKAEALGHELADARREADAAKARWTETSEAEQKARTAAAASQVALAREGKRASALEAELAKARQQLAAASRISNTPGSPTEVEVGTNDAKSGSARSPGKDAAAVEVSTVTAIPEQEHLVVRAASQSSDDETRLLARAQMLIKRGAIGAARGILERAMAEGSAEAAFTLGETYDEKMLAQWNVLGTQSDAEKARQLYRRAYDAGYAQANQQVDTTGRKQE
jgi:hypothetical protein